MNAIRAIIPKAPLINASLLVIAILGAIALAAFLFLPAGEAAEFSMYLGGLGALVVIYLVAFSRSRAFRYQHPATADLPKLEALYRLREEMIKVSSESKENSLVAQDPDPPHPKPLPSTRSAPHIADPYHRSALGKPIRLEQIEKNVRELKSQVEEISKEIDVLKTVYADELVNLPESIEPKAAGDDDTGNQDPDPAMKKGRRGLWAAIVRLLEKLFKRLKYLAGDDDTGNQDPDPVMKKARKDVQAAHERNLKELEEKAKYRAGDDDSQREPDLRPHRQRLRG